MSKYGLDFVFVSETWARNRSRPPSDAILHWNPEGVDRPMGRAHYGTALLMGEHIEKHKVRVVEGIRGKSIWWVYEGIAFGGVYLAPGEEPEGCKALLEPPGEIRGIERRVLVGDFNMRLGVITGDSLYCPRANMLNPWLNERGYVICNDDSGIPTFERVGGQEGQSIVDQIWSTLGTAVHPVTTVVSEDDIGGSDHRLVFTEILLENTGGNDGPTGRLERLLLNTNKLKDVGTRKQYQKELVRKCAGMHTRIEPIIDIIGGMARNHQRSIIEELNSDIKRAVEETALEVLGNHSRRRGGTMLLKDPELKRARKERRKHWRLWKQNGSESDREAYKQARREQRRATRAAIQRGFEEFCENIDRMADTEVSKVMAAMIKRRTRGSNSLLGCDVRSLDSYATHFEQQFAWQEFHNRTVVAAVEEETWTEVPFTPGNVHQAMRELPKAKAPGASGLRNELIREAPMEVARLLWQLFRACWETGLVPEEWSTALIHPVPKKGNLSMISNYRPISLTETLRKLYEKCLQPVLTRIVEPLDISQGGFRYKRSTLDQVASLHEAIIQRRKTLGQWPLVAYLDIKAAYDTVHRGILWQRLGEKGVHGNMLRTLQALFENVSSRVVIQGYASRSLTHQVGILQGSILSPILYAAFIDKLPAKLRAISRSQLGNTKLASFFYADDIAIVADNPSQMERFLGECENFALESCFRFQPAKCEIVASNKSDTQGCTLHGQALKRATSFVYLGMTFDVKGINEMCHVTRLCSKTADTVNMMRTVGYNGYGFATKIKKRLYETFIRPRLEYGLQLIQPRGAVLEMLNRAQYGALRAMFSVGRTTSSARLHALSGIQSMRQRCHELNGTWEIRTSYLGSGYMVKEARAAAGLRACKRSVFKSGTDNQLLVRFREQTGRRTEEDGWREVFRGIRDEGRRLEREKLWTEQGQKVVPIARGRYVTAKAVDQHRSRAIRRRLILWTLRRLIGKPGLCTNCLGERGTYEHVQSCIGAYVDCAIRLGQWLEAANLIAEIEEKCLGRQTANLRRELGAETWFEELREAKRTAMRVEFTNDKGQWASWRYWAPNQRGIT